MVGFLISRIVRRLAQCSLTSLLPDSASSFESFLKVGCRSFNTATRSRAQLAWTSGILHDRYQFLRVLRHEQFCNTAGNDEKHTISVTFVDKDGEEKQIKVPIGMSMLEAAHENDIDLEGACEGSLACSTCHVIVMDVDYYNKLEDPTDDENDMLDLAFGLTETSRLGCQVIAKPELDGIRLALPAATRNFAVDGFKPKPH